VRTFLYAIAIAGGAWLLLIAGLFVAGRRNAAREVATLLPNMVALFRGLVRDPRVPKREKRLLVIAAIWLASPIDLIPEFIPVLGPLDDAVVAALVLRRLVRVAGREVLADHWRGEPAALDRVLRLLRVPAAATPSGS
jgi:uncharacterized membrane protein YkvA (DUF1232 family)